MDIRVALRIKKADVAILASALILTAVPLRLIFRFPFDMPFVDDWLLVPWAAGDVEWNVQNLFAKISGHQSVLLKLFSFGLGRFAHWNLFLVSVLATLTFAFAFWLSALDIKSKLAGEPASTFSDNPSH